MSKEIIDSSHDLSLLEQYKMANSYDERQVGTMILTNRPNIEYILMPEIGCIKLITPETNFIELIKIDSEKMKDILVENEFKTKDNIVSFIKETIEDKSIKILTGEYEFAEDDNEKFLKDGFIHVPTKFLFNNQEVTDNIVISKHPETGEYGMSLIDRKLPPTGWAMAGGMVDDEDKKEAETAIKSDVYEDEKTKLRVVEDEASIINSVKEVGEELNLSDISVIKRLDEKISTYEVRGSLNSLISIFYSKTGFDATAGDDAQDEIWVSMSELKILLENGKFIKNNKEIILVPHHKKILQKVINLAKTDKKLKRYFETGEIENISKKRKSKIDKKI